MGLKCSCDQARTAGWTRGRTPEGAFGKGPIHGHADQHDVPAHRGSGPRSVTWSR